MVFFRNPQFRELHFRNDNFEYPWEKSLTIYDKEEKSYCCKMYTLCAFVVKKVKSSARNGVIVGFGREK